MHVVVWSHTLRDLTGLVVSSSPLSVPSGSSSGVKSWVDRHDLHASVSGVRLTAAKPAFAGATGSSPSLYSSWSVLVDA